MMAKAVLQWPVSVTATAPIRDDGAVVEALADEGHAIDTAEAPRPMAEAGGAQTMPPRAPTKPPPQRSHRRR